MRNASLIVAATLLMAACSGGGGSEVPTAISGPSSELDSSVDTGPDFVPTPDADAGSDGVAGGIPVTTEFDLAAQPSTPPIEPVPETGVPGIESSDAFCRAWSEFAGSFQVLGLVSAIGDPDNARRLEVVASSTITHAFLDMDANFPTEMATEQTSFIEGLAQPLYERALVAEFALQEAGVSQLPSLRRAWIEQLKATGLGDPTFMVATPDGVDAAALDNAVATFTAGPVPIVEDPSLVTDVATPATEAYIAANCPDGGTLAGNDDVG